MKSLWNDSEAAQFDGPLGPRIYSSRLLGRDKSLVLHGGDHTHADAVLAVSNAPEGEQRVREIYGDKAIVVPYVMAGFDLAVRCAREFSAHAGGNALGMVLVSHGVLSWGADAREAYERMIELVSMAE